MTSTGHGNCDPTLCSDICFGETRHFLAFAYFSGPAIPPRMDSQWIFQKYTHVTRLIGLMYFIYHCERRSYVCLYSGCHKLTTEFIFLCLFPQAQLTYLWDILNATVIRVLSCPLHVAIFNIPAFISTSNHFWYNSMFSANVHAFHQVCSMWTAEML